MTETGKKKEEILKPIPEPTLRRLPIYHQYLKKIREEPGHGRISSTRMGGDLDILPIQVRKDLQITKAPGKPKLGYDVGELMAAIEAFLGWNNTADAYLVGVGNLGSALLGYQGFWKYGLNVVAAFDVDERKVGTWVHGTGVLHVSKLPSLIRRTGIKIGILAVPGESAQALADTMIEAGIRAIWNFSPMKINAPSHVIVQHENLASSLAVLSKKLAEALRART